MQRPKPYYVGLETTTPDEPFSGWYFTVNDIFYGAFVSRMNAEESIDNVMFADGEIVA